jgi:hypothetical protein
MNAAKPAKTSTAESIRRSFAAIHRPMAAPEPAPQPRARRVRSVRQPKPDQPVNLIDRLPAFAPRNRTMLTFRPASSPEVLSGDFADRSVTTPGRAAVDGWRVAEQRLEAFGLHVVLSPKGNPVVTSPRGALAEGLIDQLRPVVAWVAAGKLGQPWLCDWCPAEATTLLVGAVAVPACREHADRLQ